MTKNHRILLFHTKTLLCLRVKHFCFTVSDDYKSDYKSPDRGRNREKKKKAEKEKGKKSSFSFGKKKVGAQDVMIFSKQFATMVKAGLPILNVLTMLRDQIEHPTMKEIIEDIRKSLEGGITPVSYTHLTLPTICSV